MKRDTTFENWSTPGTTLFCFMSTRTLVMFPLPNYSSLSAGTRGEGTLSPGSTFLHLNTPKDSLLRSRFFLCHATLPQRSERCVTSHETAAKETSPKIDCFFFLVGDVLLGSWRIAYLPHHGYLLFLQHGPDKHSNMPSDGTVHELTRNVRYIAKCSVILP